MDTTCTRLLSVYARMDTIILVFTDAETRAPLPVPVSRKHLVARCHVLADMLSDMALGPSAEIPMETTVSRSAAMLFASAINNSGLPRIDMAHDLFSRSVPVASKLAHWNTAALAYKYGFNTLLGYYIWAFSRAMNAAGRVWFTVRVPDQESVLPIDRKRKRDDWSDDADTDGNLDLMDSDDDDDDDEPSTDRASKKRRFYTRLMQHAQGISACAACPAEATGTCATCKSIAVCSPRCLDVLHSTCVSFYVAPEAMTPQESGAQGNVVNLLSDTLVDTRLRTIMYSMEPHIKKDSVDQVIRDVTPFFKVFSAALFGGAIGASMLEFWIVNVARYSPLLGLIKAFLELLAPDERSSHVVLVEQLVGTLLEAYPYDEAAQLELFALASLVCSFSVVKKLAEVQNYASKKETTKLEYIKRAIDASRADVVQHLLSQANISVNVRFALVMRAAFIDNADLMRLLVEPVKTEPSFDKYYEYALLESSRHGRSNNVRFLLSLGSAGGSWNSLNVFGDALNNAIAQGHAEIVKMLLVHPRVDLAARNFLAVEAAIVANNEAILRLLLDDPRVDLKARGYGFIAHARRNNKPDMERVIKEVVIARYKRAPWPVVLPEMDI